MLLYSYSITHEMNTSTMVEPTRKKLSPEGVYSMVLIAVIMGNGLIANYAPAVGVNAGTFAIDVMVLGLLFFAFIKESGLIVTKRKLIPSEFKILFVVLLVIGALTSANALATGYYAPGLMSDLRIRFLYFAIPPAMYVLLDPNEAKAVFKFFINCGVAFCLFAIVQSLFSTALDPKLLSVEYDGTLALKWSEETMSAVLRSNALMGNAIEFGGVCVMLFVASLGDLLKKGFSVLGALKVVIIAIGCYFSYSRIAFAGMLLLAVLLFFRLSRFKGVNRFLSFTVIASIALVSIYLLIGDSALAERFLGQDEFTSASNDSHLANTIESLQVIWQNAMFGTGLGTQLVSDQRATADGWWFQLAAETGLAIFILYIFCFGYLAVKAYRTQKQGSGFAELISVTVLFCLLYFFLASFVNSSFIGRADITLFFVLVACWLSSCSEDGLRKPDRERLTDENRSIGR